MGSLNKPPEVLLNALSKLIAQHERRPSKVPHFLEKMLEDNPYMATPQDGRPGYAYQGEKNDRLFQANYKHAGGPNCDRCDTQKKINRDPRISSAPRIHYGIIASGNTLVKSGPTRDSIVRGLGDDCYLLRDGSGWANEQFPLSRHPRNLRLRRLSQERSMATLRRVDRCRLCERNSPNNVSY